ncbi:hypothetical protein N7E81_01445 [Reichenbachiella carrageenanivorans]|uniref:TRAP-type C4-dicarboxylate transport system, small permease component n=1 Tax=Reichenbachiella carrageenanivorans TaxID=2979869 RepID=A0ABY6D3T9_9BACT|nr:hypothetical protein [Reichenbachiella carrageenanivorans]UXX79773.1 hypothetical protein N7E81_01445 [Reichenbachiella carrageenanivorans]
MKDLDIKDIWKGSGVVDESAFSLSKIEGMISRGSHSLVRRFVRALTWEIWINLIVLTIVGVRLLVAREWLGGGSVLVLDVVFYLYYKKLIDNLKSEQIDSTVLAYLYNVQAQIRQFIRHLKIAVFGISVLACLLVISIHANGFYNVELGSSRLLLSLGAGLGLAVPFSFYFIHLMYGKKAKKLAQMIDSLESEEA